LGEAASAAAALGMADSLPRPQESSNHFANATLDAAPHRYFVNDRNSSVKHASFVEGRRIAPAPATTCREDHDGADAVPLGHPADLDRRRGQMPS
jgi:hypothetical protein